MVIEDQQTTDVFTRWGAIVGFCAYIIVGLIILAVFL